MIEELAGISVEGRYFSQKKTLTFFPKADDRLALVYGANGSGKSTISTAFKTLRDQEYSELTVSAKNSAGEDIALQSPPIHVFNEEYIDSNVKINDDGLGSIVLLGEQVELQSKINDALAKQKIEDKKLENIQTKLDQYYDVKNPLSPQYHWDQIKHILKVTSGWAKRDSEIRGRRQNSAVKDAIVKTICSMEVDQTLEQLQEAFAQKKTIWDQAVSPDPAYSKPIQTIQIRADVEDQLLSVLSTKLEKPFLTKREQRILTMVQIGFQKRIEDSQQHFSNTHERTCPYCFQEVTDEYKQELLESISRVLNKDVDKHKEQLATYQIQELSDDYRMYSNLDAETVRAIQKEIEEYNQIVQLYRRAISEKLENIYTPIYQNNLGLSVKLKEINRLLRVLENKRYQFMRIVKRRENLTKELIKLNKQIAHIHCKKAYITYQKQDSELKEIKTEFEKQESAAKLAEQHLRDLLRQKENLAIAIECINNSLAYVFFSKDRLSIELRNDRYYLKSRGRDVKPKNVSQGERNIIALCYFFVQIGSNKALSKLYENEQLLVIDDPVSSFDFENKVGILSLLRREIKKIIFGNNKSKVILFTHDLSTMFDAQKAFQEIGKAAAKSNKENGGVGIASLNWLELKQGDLVGFKKSRSEYALLIDDIFRFADGDNSHEISIGNKMRRVLEAFSSFCYRKGIAEVSCDSDILSRLGEDAEYFENRMYRLILHGESHYEEQIYSFRDSSILYEYFSLEEKIKTARDMLCFMFLLNPQHVIVYLPNAKKKIESWCKEIRRARQQPDVNHRFSDKLKDNTTTKVVKLYDIPLSAGGGTDLLDNEVAGEDYNTTVEECDFALRIRGDSMEPQIHNGSIVLIHRQETLESGETGAFYFNGQVFCKKYSCAEGKTQLISMNSAYAPIIVRENDVIRCYGKVIPTVPLVFEDRS